MVQCSASNSGLIFATWALVGATVIITTVGWWFVDRQRKKQFRLEVRNNARLKITSAIRDYQRWLNEASRQFVLLMNNLTNAESLIVLRGLEAMDTNLPWIFQLEEHEILYPETRECRSQMMLADDAMRDKIRIPLSDEDRWEDIKKGVVNEDIARRVLRGYQYAPGLIALMEDLRVHLQNVCFSEITKARVKGRTPDPARPHLKLNKKKEMLEIIPPNGEPRWPPIP